MSTTVMYEPRVALPLDAGMPGGHSTRSFWTRRKRTAMSLFAVMALVAGIAVAFKVFEQEVPNNVVRDASNFSYTIEAMDTSAGESVFRPATGATPNDGVFRQDLETCPPLPASCDVSIYPGDSRTSRVLITNTNDPARRDASFQVWITNIQVLSFNPATNTYANVTATTNGNRFLSFWKFSVDKQTYTNDPTGLFCTEDECTENQSDSDYSEACAENNLQTFTRTNPCKLGIIRAMGSETGPSPVPPGATVDPTDDREYLFHMSEADDNTDQSLFQGWRVIFTLNFAARVPAEAESGRYSGAFVP